MLGRPDQYYVKRLNGRNVKRGKNKRDLAEQLRADIRAYKKEAARQSDDLMRFGRGDFSPRPQRFTRPSEAIQCMLARKRHQYRTLHAVRVRGCSCGRGIPLRERGTRILTVDLPVMQELLAQEQRC